MRKPTTTPPAPASKSLAQQKADFTAEGSPPPGQVSTSVPMDSSDPAMAKPPPAPARPSTRRKR